MDGCLRFGVGAEVDLTGLMTRDGVDLATALFSESATRAVVAVSREAEVALADLCSARAFPLLRLGETSVDASVAVVSPVGDFTIPLVDLDARSTDTLPRHFA